MIATTSISIALMRILIPKFRVVREAVNSTVALYAADSSLEWCAYTNNVDYLTARYTFEEGSGNSSADLSGNNNTLTISGPVWVTGQSGSGLFFDGIVDDAYVPSSSPSSKSLDIEGSFTTEAWISPSTVTSPGALSETIIIKGSGITANYGMRQVMNQISCFFYSGGSLHEHVSTAANLQVGAWQNVACVFDDSADTMTIYVGGAPVFIGTETGTPDITTDLFKIGNNWTGSIDEVRILDSPAQNLTNYDIPVISSPSMTNGSTYKLHYGNSNTASNCREGVFDHRAVGTFQGISRSLEVF